MQTSISSPNTRAESNRRNARFSTGPKSREGKSKVASNAQKHGFFAQIDKLNPADASVYQQIVSDLRNGLNPANPTEDHLVREVAMLSARLQRLEAAEFALLCEKIDGDPDDLAKMSAAYDQSLYAIERLSRIETQLRRAYNRAWDRLERLQKERRKLESVEVSKQSQLKLNRQGQTTKPSGNSEPASTAASHPGYESHTISEVSAPRPSSLATDDVSGTPLL